MQKLQFNNNKKKRLNFFVFKTALPMESFDPREYKDFEKLMIVDEDEYSITLSQVFSFTHLDLSKCLFLSKNEIEQNNYWIFP